MTSSMHDVDFRYSKFDATTLFRYAHEHDVWEGGRYDALASEIRVYSHPWLDPATQEVSEIIGSFHFSGAAYFYEWFGDLPGIWGIETEEGFSLDDLLQALGRLGVEVLGCVKHGFLPREKCQP